MENSMESYDQKILLGSPSKAGNTFFVKKRKWSFFALATVMMVSQFTVLNKDSYGQKYTKKLRIPANIQLRNQLLWTKKSYRMGDMSGKVAWEKLDKIANKGAQLYQADRVVLLQTQASLLQEAGYPILASIFASQALKTSQRPLERSLESTWELLHQVSEKKPIQTILEIVAEQVNLGGKIPPSFKNNWRYITANAAARRGDYDVALAQYNLLRIQDKYFLSAKYQQAMILVEQNKLEQAETALKSIIFSKENDDGLTSTEKNLIDYTLLALGRIYYERGKFEDSIKSYRLVSKNGPNFYDALFEQSWAFFMGGYPMHALGAIHGAESPFFSQVFNPESTMLKSMIYYWLCQYDESRNALADFMEKHGSAIEELNEFLDRQRSDYELGYQLFENMVSGVSGKSLGLPHSILKTNAERDSMLFLRDQYAAVVEEKARLDAKGIFSTRNSTERANEYLDRWIASLRKEIGKRFITELQETKKDFERLYAQAQFLYVELLMSEKDQILGKNLHASTKITRVAQQFKVSGWADKTQAWKDSRTGEYWWDEVGFYITPVASRCQGAPQ
jgi:tetratricopeptide (TPR) repeat protein